MTLLAYHNDPKIKQKYIDRVKAHREADELIKGIGWKNGKGCAVGCTLEKYDHSLYPKELGIPEILARLEDCIFEGLPNDYAQLWPERFLDAIKVGCDLSMVGQKFLLRILQNQYENLKNNSFFPIVKKAIEDVINIFTLWIENGKLDISAAWSAESAARSAERSAESAAWSADSAAWSAARSAESAAWSAESAAWSAERSAESVAWSAVSAAWSAAWSAESAAWSAESAARSAESVAWSTESAARSAASAACSAAMNAEMSTEMNAAWQNMANLLIKLIKSEKEKK